MSESLAQIYNRIINEENAIDAEYLRDSLEAMKEDLDDDDDPEGKIRDAIDWVVTRSNQTHPDGDITIDDIVGMFDHHSSPDSVPKSEVRQIVEFLLSDIT